MFLRGGDFGNSGELLLLLVPILGAGASGGSGNSFLLFQPYYITGYYLNIILILNYAQDLQ